MEDLDSMSSKLEKIVAIISQIADDPSSPLVEVADNNTSIPVSGHEESKNDFGFII